MNTRRWWPRRFSVWLFVLAMLVLGPLMLYFSLVSASETREFLSRAERAEGTVVDVKVYQNNKGGRSYTPIVQFRIPSNEIIEFRGHKSFVRPLFFQPAYRRDERVEVLYEVATPTNARVGNFFSLWGWILAAGLFGLFFCTVGTLALCSPRFRGWRR